MAEPEEKNEEITEPKEPVETPAEEPKETPVEEPKEEPKEEPAEEPKEPKLESKTSFLRKLKKVIQIKKTPAEEPSEEEEPEPEEPAKPGDKEYEEISPNFIEAAQKAKWSDEQIVEFAEKYTNKELDKLIGDVLTGVAEEPSEKPPEEKPPEKKEPEGKLEELLKDGKLSPEAQSVLNELLTKTKEVTEKLKDIEDSIGKTKGDEAIQEYVDMEDSANKMFDKAAETFEEFGKTADMPRFPDGRLVPIGPSYDARSKVWGMAVKLFQAGAPFDNAMEDALQWHKGASTEKKTREKVVKDLKKRSTKLTPKRSEKNVQKQYAEGEEDERKADVVKAAYAKTGVKGY